MKIRGSTFRLAVYIAIGLTIVIFIWQFEKGRAERERARREEDPTPRLLQERETARGPSRPHEYLPDSIVRVTAFAPARRTDSTWIVLAPDSLLMAADTRVVDDDEWVTVYRSKELLLPPPSSGTLSMAEAVEIHSTFLEAWAPVVVDGVLEVAGYKLWSASFMGMQGTSARGLLRNISDAGIRDCVVTVRFLGKEGKLLGERKTQPMTVVPGKIVEFTTPSFLTKSEQIVLEVRFVDATGRRHQSDPISLVAIPPPP